MRPVAGVLTRRSFLRAGAAGAAAGLVAATGAACGDDDPPHVAASATPATPSRTVASAAPAGPDAERVGQYRLAQPGVPGGLDWNPAGSMLAVTGPGQVALFPGGAGPPSSGGAPSVTVKAHGTSMVNSVAWAPDGGRFATVGTDSAVQFWTADGSSLWSVQLTDVERHGLVRWSPTGNRVVVSTGNTPMVLDVGGAAPGQPVAGTKVEVLYEIAWAPDGGSFYVVGVSGVTRCPAPSGAPSATLTDPAVRVWRSATVAPDGRVAVAARAGNRDLIRVYSPDLTTPGPEFELPAGSSTATTMRFSSDGKRLAIAFQSGPIGVWEVTGTQSDYLGGYRGHPKAGDGGYSLAWQPGTERVASLDADGTIHLWKITA
jgi:WD40 repeat protein